MSASLDGSTAARLDEWLDRHGPLWTTAALLLALDLCGRTSALRTPELRRRIGSLQVGGITRQPTGAWVWDAKPRPATGDSRPDVEAVERIGVVLFQCLTGKPIEYPKPLPPELRESLRRHRPDLPAAVVDLIVTSVSVKPSSGFSLGDLARELRAALGESRPTRAWKIRRVVAAASAAIVIVTVLGLWMLSGSTEADASAGLTRTGMTVRDALTESVFALAVVEEHTAALQVLSDLRRLWTTRVASTDPRVAWVDAHESWIRTLRGDRLTAEQGLHVHPTGLSAQLGEAHPYVRTIRLALAATVEARGASAQAIADAMQLRADAERATNHLMRVFGDSPAFDPDPVPPGVLAHVASNQPEREGFRQTTGGFYAPLTSSQKELADRHGWRLWIVAEGSCRVSIAAGSPPRLLRVETSRGGDARWRVNVTGSEPAIRRDAPPADQLGIRLAMDSQQQLDVRLGDGQPLTAALDTSNEPLASPYSLSFSESVDDQGCAVVWLEIPFPPGLGFRKR